MHILIPVTKAEDSLTIDTSDLVAEGHAEAFEAAFAASPALRYAVQYGLTQAVNDAHAALSTRAADFTTAGVMALATKKLDKILAGEIGARGASQPRNPVETIARREAKAEIVAALRAAGKKIPKADDEAWAAAIAKVLAGPRGEALRAKAKEELARREAEAATINLEEIGL